MEIKYLTSYSLANLNILVNEYLKKSWWPKDNVVCYEELIDDQYRPCFIQSMYRIKI